MTKKPSKKVIARLTAVKRFWRKYPKTFNMNRWGYAVERDDDHPCGTMGCIAGTLIFLERGPLSGKVTHEEWDAEMGDSDAVVKEANQLLEHDGNDLWYADAWPQECITKHMYDDGKGGINYAAVTIFDAIKRINHFIRTGV